MSTMTQKKETWWSLNFPEDDSKHSIIYKYSEHLLGARQCACSCARCGLCHHEVYILTGMKDILNKCMLNKLLNLNDP